jgi:hypothetical protein
MTFLRPRPGARDRPEGSPLRDTFEVMYGYEVIRPELNPSGALICILMRGDWARPGSSMQYQYGRRVQFASFLLS